MTPPDTDGDMPEPARLRRLRHLVTALTLTFIAAIVVITALLVYRLGPGRAVPLLPQDMPVPAGEELTGFAMNPAWTVLITRDATGVQHLHLLRAGESRIHQSVEIRADER